MTDDERVALAVVLARLCAEAVGDWRHKRAGLLAELSDRLPASHSATTGTEDEAAVAARSVSDLLEPHGIHVLTGQHDRRVRIRLIPTD
ncbi:hypothetical protein M8C11_18830 [Micromonospora sp. CPM1]|uniref:hypothetical protein n=1 Tax=Micromonospora sp. CPM1 TaxID=2944809 RepID=UPI00207C1973|nr:hypothetical protein [Micromonospora sp. CPM1]MCO1616772.1 hypothetical protein [Micromonospora sp. CPM1]